MTPEEFIINEIKTLVELFPNVSARYENHQMSNTHFVEVLPNEVYRLNEDFQSWEETVVFKFIELYPDQNLCFLTDDDIVKIETSNFEAKGKYYDFNYSVNDGCYRSVDVANFSTTHYENAISQIIVNQPLEILSNLTEISFNSTKNSGSDKSKFDSLIDMGGPSIENANELIYPLAA